MANNVHLYALSTCAWCKKTKKFLEEKKINYHCDDVDLLTGDEKAAVKTVLAKHNPRLSYPTLVIDDETVIVGYDEERLQEVFGDGQQEG
jgi:glutaredoxin-like protein NrdH